MKVEYTKKLFSLTMVVLGMIAMATGEYLGSIACAVWFIAGGITVIGKEINE